MTFRRCLFWIHLITGCAIGIVVGLMSFTGVLLMYERQVLAQSERQPFLADPPPGTGALPVEELLRRFAQQGGVLAAGSTLTIRADPREPAQISAGREAPLSVNRYTGRLLGRSGREERRFFQKLTAWHRWLGMEGEGRATAKAVTGACNFAFLFILLSGMYLWLPSVWSRQHLAPIVWIRSTNSGKARDFNWHNVIGLWCLVPLLVMVLTALPMSYSWANNLIYSMAGTEAPRGGPGPGPERQDRRGSKPVHVQLNGLDQLWARAQRQVPDWRSISMRLPDSGKRPVSFSIDAGDGGQPQKRSTLTLDAQTGAVVRWERFEDANAGRRLRMWTRFLHTGEALGVAGQTIAGVASLGGVVLVWTGISLALRRLADWRRRRSRR